MSQSAKAALLINPFHERMSIRATMRYLNDLYGEGSFKHKYIQDWFAKFAKDDFSLKRKPGSGKKQKVKSVDFENYLKLHPEAFSYEIAAEFQVHPSTVARALKRLGYSLKLDQWVPYNINDSQKQKRVNMSRQLLQLYHDDPSILDRIITCDEKWIFHENTRQDRHWRLKGKLEGKRLKKAKRSIHCAKTMALVFWDARGVVYHEFLPKNQTINAQYYCNVLAKLNEAIQKDRPEYKNGGFVLQQDNARPHTAIKTKNFLKDLGWTVLVHPPYSPDLAPSDYYLFRCMANQLNKEKKRFANRQEAEQWVTDFLDQKNADFYKKGIYKLPERWEKCIDEDGAYFDD